MKRLLLATISTACLAALIGLIGCSKQAPAPRDVEASREEHHGDVRRDDPKPILVVPPDAVVPVVSAQDQTFDALVTRLTEPTNQDKYDAALDEAFNLLADRHYNQALAALQTAQGVQDTEMVRREIAKIQELIRQEEAGQKTALDVQTVLDDGKPEEAAELGRKALAEFGGGGDITDNLAQQKREADTIVAAALPTDDDRFTRFRAEGDEARGANNLRGASLAYETALRFRDDADVRRQQEAIRAALTRYDDGRSQANRLRRDPASLEDALAALNDAKAAWETPQINQDIDEITLALQRRRDRISVAEFEVRGDVGLPGAGRTVAEELLPHFKARFDLVERERVGRILDELKLEANDLVGSPDGQREVGRLARIRYIVVGSITPLNGVTANARLVNVQTGVIEQTARMSAPTLEALLPRLRTLARVLQMTDDQKLAFEAAMADRAAPPVQAIQPIDVAQPVLPPPPPVFNVNIAPPPPIVAFAPAPPNFFVGVEIGAFRRFPVLVVDVPPPPPQPIEVVLVQTDPRRGRLMALSLELGDDLFRRGRYREAHRHYSLALTLSNGNADVALRVGRCVAFLPPPPPPAVVIVAPPPVVPLVQVFPPALVIAPPPPVVLIPPPPVFRPRLIVFSFLMNTPPGLVPPNLGDWAADQFAAYFGASYEVVDRGEVCWYMGRLGLTFAQVVNDPGARIALAQAMNVSYYCFGAVIPTASLDVEAHLMDASTGNRTATGKIHVQDHVEMKLRIGELAAQIGAPGAKGQAIALKGAESEKALNEARAYLKAGKPVEAKAVAERGLMQAPESAALRTMVAQADQQIRQAQIAEQRKIAEAASLKAEADAKAKRAELAKISETARLKAEAEAKNRSEADRKAVADRKLKAAQQLEASARKAFDGGNFVKAVGDLRSAAALNPSPVLDRELAQAQAKLDEANRKAIADEAARKAAAEKTAGAASLLKVNEEKTRLAADEKAKQDQRAKEVAGLVAAAKKDMAAKDFSKALASAQAANQLSHTAETESLLADVRRAQTLASLKNDDARRAAEKKIAEDKAKQDKYQQELKLAGDAVQVKKYDDAIVHFKAAQQLFSTDVALTGLKHAEDLKVRADADANKDKIAQEAATKRNAEVKRLLGESQKALAAQKFDEALKATNDALKVSPGNVDVLTARTQVERAREAAQKAVAAFAKARPQPVDPRLKTDYDAAMAAARAALKKPDFIGAITSANAALKLMPNDPTATALLKDAQAGEARVKTAFDRDLLAGKTALANKQYDVAIKSANDALAVIPNDPAALALLKDAQAGKTGADIEGKRKADYAAAIQAARTALTAKQYDAAIKDANDALKLFPGDPAAAALAKDAQTAKASIDLDAKRKTDYVAAIQAGRTALIGKKYDEAIKDAQDALKLFPGDATAATLLKDAQTAKAAIEVDAKKKADYVAAIQAGRAALAGKKYDEAIKDAQEALKLYPGDPLATGLVKDAQTAKANEKPVTPPPVVLDYAKSMQKAVGLEKAKSWAEAAAAYRDALKAKPGDVKAAFGANMAEGQRAIEAKRWTDAQRLFEEAVRLVPSDADAKALLKRAKDMK